MTPPGLPLAIHWSETAAPTPAGSFRREFPFESPLIGTTIVLDHVPQHPSEPSTDAWSDERIVQQVLAGETELFNTLVRRYQGPLFHLASTKLGNATLAEDCVQESFLAAFRSLATYNSTYGFRTWLWTILLNQCRRQGARRQRRSSREHSQDAESLAEEFGSSEDSPARRAIQHEQADQLQSLLQRLPDVQADALRLRFFGGLKFPEIAEVMQCSLSSAKGRVRKGLEKISAWLSEPATPKLSQLEQE